MALHLPTPEDEGESGNIQRCNGETMKVVHFEEAIVMSRKLPSSDPDRQLEKRVQAALSATGYRTLAVLDCTVVDGEVTLAGVVSSYFLKQIAQEAVLQLKTVRRVHNALRVRPK
jgi:osmotically-inducible protein OsmY